MSDHAVQLPGWIEPLNRDVLAPFQTRLCGGFEEPFYLAHADDGWAEIRFTRDYERSALHELAHWCIASAGRRRRDDYGYWYAPDGRSREQQQRFFRVEIKPQAIEKHFCMALGIPFAVSVDNLGNPALEGVSEFARAVDRCSTTYARQGLPARAGAIHGCLRAWHDAPPGAPPAA
jgi:elongation factor P hydroxylase